MAWASCDHYRPATDTMTIAQGALRWRTDGDVTSLRGIPFAAPPVGDLRWRPPTAPLGWEGIRDATRFGRIDVLVNNAGNFFGGFFEELSQTQIERQLATNLLGPMNVARAVLPVMRRQRSGHIISISSLADLVGGEFCSAYVGRSSAWRAGWRH